MTALPAGDDPRHLAEAAVAALRAGDRATARTRAEAALAREPATFAARIVLAHIAVEERDPAATLAHADAAALLAPDSPEPHNLRGVALIRLGRIEAAEAAFRGAVERDPNHAEAHGNLGTILVRDGRHRPAIELLERATALRPTDRDWRFALARALEEEGELARAAAAAAPLVTPETTDPRELNLLARLLRQLGDSRQAAALYDRCAALEPERFDHRYAAALEHLRAGHLGPGWAGVFDRLRAGADSRAALFPQPLWDGQALAGRRILLWRQFGVGDEILALGLLPDLVAEGGGALVECDPRLEPLLRRSFPSLDLFPFLGPLATPPSESRDPTLACKASTIDLALRYRPDFAAFPRHAGYLRADAAATARLSRRYREHAGPERRVVGISWDSRAAPESERKRMTLELLEPVLRVPGIAWIDLQYGDTEGERAAAAARGIEILHDPEVDPLVDLDAFAAQVASVDLVITISNTTAHMAGALGVPVWTMVPGRRGNLWYWFTDRADSPWYPSMRLFRQRVAGDWTRAVAGVAEALAALPLPGLEHASPMAEAR